jgi:hypothetical protein
MPFQSEKQRRYLWANEPEIAREWTDRYGASQGGLTRLPLRLGTGEEMTAIGTPLTNQMAFTPGSALDDQIKKLNTLEQMGYPQPNLQNLKDMDMKQFKEKGIPLSLDAARYVSVPEGMQKIISDASLATENPPEGIASDYLGSRNPIPRSGRNVRTSYDPAFGELYQRDAWNTGYPEVATTRRNIYDPNSEHPQMDRYYDPERWALSEEEVVEEPSGINKLSPYQDYGQFFRNQPVDEGYTKWGDTDNLMEYINKNPELMQTMKDKAGGIWESGIDKGQWALGAAGAAAKMPFQMLAKAANIVNPLSPGSRNYNPDLQGQIDMLKASGILGGEDPSGPYRITGGPLAGKNLVSGFGTNDYGRMLQKRIEYFRQQKAKKGKLTDEQNRRLREAEDAKRKADAAKAARTTHPGGGRKTQGNVGGWSATSTSSGSGQGGGYGTGTGYTDKSSVSSGGWKW